VLGEEVGVLGVELLQHVPELADRDRLADRAEDGADPVARVLARDLQLPSDPLHELVAEKDAGRPPGEVRLAVTTLRSPRHIVIPMKKRLFIGLIVLALLILAALGAVIGTGGD
jgi:hypothetical protein